MNAYIFTGPELGKKQDAVDNVRKNFSGSRENEEFVFYYGETPCGTIADTLQSSGLFSASSLVIVKNAELIKKKNEVDLLVSCIKNLDENTALILLSDEIKLAAGLENAVPKQNQKIFYEMFERDKHDWLRQFFQKEGFKIEKDAIEAILELVENNTEALKKECSRFLIFQEKGKPISSQDIEKWLSHNREESAFTLFSRIASGDLSKSLESLSAMLAAKESAVSILAGLAWCFRKLGSYLQLAERGEANNFVELRKIGLSSPKAKDDYSAASRRFNLYGTEACLALTAKYEMLLRSSLSVFEKLLMEKYILEIFSQKTQRNS